MNDSVGSADVAGCVAVSVLVAVAPALRDCTGFAAAETGGVGLAVLIPSPEGTAIGAAVAGGRGEMLPVDPLPLFSCVVLGFADILAAEQLKEKKQKMCPERIYINKSSTEIRMGDKSDRCLV